MCVPSHAPLTEIIDQDGVLTVSLSWPVWLEYLVDLTKNF